MIRTADAEWPCGICGEDMKGGGESSPGRAFLAHSLEVGHTVSIGPAVVILDEDDDD